MLVLLAISAGAQDFPPTFEELEAAYQYLFSEEQRQRFDRMGRDADRIELWNEYWRQHDPSADTDFNENKDLFLRRLNDTRYFADIGVLSQGWRGHRGRVYILFGAPQEVYRGLPETVDRGGPEREVWVYIVNVDGEDRRLELLFESGAETDELILATRIRFPRTMSTLPRLPEIMDHSTP